MVPAPNLIDQVAAFHEDAYAWAVACSSGDREAGSDTLQECYVKVARGRAIFSGKSSLKTWWLAVIRLTALEQRRGWRRWRDRFEAFHTWLTSLGGESPEEVIEATTSLDADQLATALARLPARQAEILRLVFQHELSVQESAAVMGVSLGSARQHYDRAKKRLRHLLITHARLLLCHSCILSTILI
jgi:RNA polymerase sigma factor (sigma-70 family)